jgi:hypothetical protein
MARALVQTLSDAETSSPAHARDWRWDLVLRVAAGRQFAKAPLLSKFLLHVCDLTLHGNQSEICEHQIGVQVFGRPVGYNSSEDNIVRNYARQLRKRLSDHFAGEGSEESVQIEIPVGGYVPVFVPHQRIEKPAPVRILQEVAGRNAQVAVAPGSRGRGPQRWRAPLYLAVYSVLLASVVAYFTMRVNARKPDPRVSHALWAQLFSANSDTFVVPADSGFGILQNLSKTRLPLAEYVNGRYAALPLPPMNVHDANDLYTQRYTSVVDLEVASTLVRLPEVVPTRLILRFARDLRMDDLKRGNAILIGSLYSNPWAEIFQRNLNFRFDYRPEVNDSWIVNENPETGEEKTYENNWDGPSHQTYGVIAFAPNLDGNGHVLLIQGLDMAGTQAAAELLFRGNEILPILEKAASSGGGLRPFEVLLQTTSIGANAPSARIIATRIHAQ